MDARSGHVQFRQAWNVWDQETTYREHFQALVSAHIDHFSEGDFRVLQNEVCCGFQVDAGRLFHP